MVIKTTKSFNKQYSKLPETDKTRFKQRLETFQANPYDKVLRNHGLRGKYLGYRSIDIRGDLRALYYIEADIIYIFAFVGTHSLLYAC
jgi:addiction module RelE/StbE family toxin